MEDYQRKLAGIWKRNNCHPVKSVLPILIQAPVFIGFFSSLQSLARAKVVTRSFISDCSTMSQAQSAFLYRVCSVDGPSRLGEMQPA